MATDVFPVVGPDDNTIQINAIEITHPTISGWLVVFYGAMAIALMLASLRLVYPPDESRIDPTITSGVQ